MGQLPPENDPPQNHRASGEIVLSAGMGSAGSGWYYNLTNDLLVASGQTGTHELRGQYNLGDILFTRNCAHDLRRKTDVARLVEVARSGHTFAVKTHKPPSRHFRRLAGEKLARATYIFRDPRDVVASVFRRGQKGRQRGNRSAFARFNSITQVMYWTRWRLLRVYDAWMQQPNVHALRYEDLCNDPLAELQRLRAFLGCGHVTDASLQQIVSTYQGKSAMQIKGSHYHGGGKRRHELSTKQLTKCNRLFAKHLVRMGYE